MTTAISDIAGCAASPEASDTKISFRRAAAADVPFLGRVLEMASRGHLACGPWDLMFPDDGERRRALEHIAGNAPVSWCHRQWFHVADLDGAAAAAMVAFEAADVGDTSLAPSLFDTFGLLGWSPERVASTIAMIEPYAECFPDMPAGTWIVENVATREDARRHGLVRELLGRALDEGRRRGFRRAQISCLIGNDAAQRAYERAGFEVVEDRRRPEFEKLIGAPGFVRMCRDLEEA